MSVLFTDAGTGADANPIGGSYVTLTGIGGLRRVSNQIGNASGTDTDSGAYINITTPNDHYCQGTPTVVGGRDGGPMVRVQTLAASGVLITDYNATDVEAYVLVAGSFGTQVDRDTGTYQTTSVVRLQAVGTAYTSKIDAATINSFTNATFSSGKAGFFFYDAAQRWTNIEVGDFTTGFTLAIDQISYALSLQSVTLKADRVLPIGQLSYALSLQAVSMVGGMTLQAAQISYALTLQDVTAKADHVLPISQLSYALTLRDVAMTAGARLQVDQLSYGLSLQAVTLTGPASTYSLSIGQIAYALSLGDSLADYEMSAAQLSYALTLQDVALLCGRKVTNDQLSYALSLQSLGLYKGSALAIGQLAYSLSVQALGFVYVGSFSLTCEKIDYGLSLQQVALISSANRGEPYRTTPLNWWTKGL